MNKRNNQKRSRRQNRQPRRQGRSNQRSVLVERSRFRDVPERIAKFARTTVIGPYQYAPATGWNATAYDMEINFSLNQTQVYIAGALYTTVPNTGASDFTALYDQYRIDMVELSIMYGVNAYIAPGTTSGVGSSQNPVLLIAFDPTDSSVTSMSSILQYNDLKVIQLCSEKVQNGYALQFRPVPLITAGGSPAAVSFKNAPWISKDTPTVPHYGVKLFLDNLGGALPTPVGNLEIYVKYHLSMKLPQ